MPAMRAAGYDYAELRVVDLRPDDDETVYAPIKRRIEDAGLPPEALNVFIPPHHPVVGPARDLEGLRAYVTTAMGRMRDLGTRLVVFGSGGARSTPPGFDHHLVPGQLQDFLLLAGGIAADHDMDLVIEPLWRDVCDTINTIVEGFVAARQSGHPRVWTLADWFHVFHNDEPLGNPGRSRAAPAPYSRTRASHCRRAGAADRPGVRRLSGRPAGHRL